MKLILMISAGVAITRGVNLIEIEVSDNKEEWRSLGEFNLLNITAPQPIEFEKMEAFQYFQNYCKNWI